MSSEKDSLIMKKQDRYYSYCFCLKELIDTREPTLEYCLVCTTGLPWVILFDFLAFFPQCINNNVKLCC